MNEVIRGCFAGVLLGLAYFVGWLSAHAALNTECIKQQSFYVAENVFDCKLREGVKGKTS